jgi:hypothetical protein
MSKYQAHISGQDGQFVRTVQPEYPDDISTAVAAQQLQGPDHGVELWQPNHKIAQFDREPDAKTFAKARFRVLGYFSVMLSLGGCGGVDLECDSLEARNSVVKTISDDHNNALLNYAANNSNAVAAMVSEAKGEADKKAILERAKRSAVYRLGDTVLMESRDRAGHAVTCSVALDVTVADTTAQKNVDFNVKQTTDGKMLISVDRFLF